jgi:hypothetical protein
MLSVERVAVSSHVERRINSAAKRAARNTSGPRTLLFGTAEQNSVVPGSAISLLGPLARFYFLRPRMTSNAPATRASSDPPDAGSISGADEGRAIQQTAAPTINSNIPNVFCI